ncbi:hypothetical protein [Caenimonas koreensis]|uniref:hypothetical protein n=1 Tax=Caenimonas koreensis TaxID=367474 RepID=UPI003784466F
MESKTIQIEDLRLACDRIFSFILNDLGIAAVELDKNLYWTLPEEVRYDMAHTPTPDHVGSLIDDYEFVRSAVADSDQALPLMFQHLAPLLEALSTKVQSYR